MANVTYDLGDLVRSSVTFTIESSGVPDDPDTVSVSYIDPSGNVTTKVFGVDSEVIKDDIGDYHIDIDADEADTWYHRWFGTGNIIAPPAVWAAAALDAGRQAHRKGPDPVSEGATRTVPLAVGAATVAGVVARRRAFHNAQARGRTRAEYLQTAPRIDPQPAAEGPVEHSEEDIATLRAFLDRGLAPLDSWDGYDDIEQFQTSSLRYQLFMCQWVLNLAQLHHTPSFHGYLSAAQRQLIDKVTQPKVWRYWALEQSWGNLSLDWDPMKKDNIMLSGYLGVGIGAYESTTGDSRYRDAAALPFRLGKRTWP